MAPATGRARAALAVLVVGFAGCGGGDAPVELEIDRPPAPVAGSVVLTGSSFVPDGSTCPPSGEFVRIGTLGPHEIVYTNAGTDVTGPVFDDLWVCNAGDGRRMRWTSNPIALVPGDNVVTVRMTAGPRASQATVTLRLP